MKWLLPVSVALAALAVTTAHGADVPPSRAIPPAHAPVYVPFFSWNGLYFGINAGYAWGQSKWTNTVTGANTGNFDASGAVLGGTVGFNYQTRAMLFGIEADIGWSNIKGSSIVGCGVPCETSIDWLGTLRGRFGYALDRFLPYLTAGMAYGRIAGSVPIGSGFDELRAGWTAGGGMEYAFVNNWSAKVEYLYVDLGKATCNAACSGTVPFDLSFNSHLFRGGLNYKF
jgi:outer membrane immunogenic protein